MSSELVFRLAFGAIFYILLIRVAIHRGKAQAERGGVTQKVENPALWWPLRLGGAVLWLSCLIYPFWPAVLTWSALPLPEWLRWTGLPLGLLALIVGFSAMAAIGSNVTRTVVTREDHELITHGAYRYVRHPLYTAGLLGFGGLALLSASALLMALIVAAFVLINLRLPAEEAALEARFGEYYRSYKQRTGAFIPKLG